MLPLHRPPCAAVHFMLLGAALRAGTGLQGWGAENATLHRRLQLGKGTAPSPEVFL